MDWNGNPNLRVPYVPRLASENFSFFYNYNYDQSFPGMEMKQPSMMQTGSSSSSSAHHAMLPISTNKLINTGAANIFSGQDPKKKRLSTEQLESLENSFQDEIKLDPERKMKLAKDLRLQPRQIAVWFQNRRARWKGKQLERLYDALKQEYDAVSRDKQKLQQEVMALRGILKDQVTKKQRSTGYTEVSGEETVESTSIPSLDRSGGANVDHHQFVECNNYVNYNVDDDFNPVMGAPYHWGNLA